MAEHPEVNDAKSAAPRWRRRTVLRAAGLVGGAAACALRTGALHAQAPSQRPPEADLPIPAISPQAQQIELDRVIDKMFKGATIREGRVTVDSPTLADNGNSVPASIQVDSPMTEADHVREIHMFLARNPRPLALSATIGPWAGRARVDTRVRMAASGRIFAIAVMNDGSCWSGHKDVVVTVAACLDGS